MQYWCDISFLQNPPTRNAFSQMPDPFPVHDVIYGWSQNLYEIAMEHRVPIS